MKLLLKTREFAHIHLHSESQKYLLKKQNRASFTSLSLASSRLFWVTWDFIASCPIFYLSVISKAALSSLSRSHSHRAGRPGPHCPSLLIWIDRLFGHSCVFQGPIPDKALHSARCCVLTLGLLSFPIGICKIRGRNLNRLWSNLHLSKNFLHVKRIRRIVHKELC